jgi:hypothetical protein
MRGLDSIPCRALVPVALLAAALSLGLPGDGLSYILPAEEIIRSMTLQVSRFETLLLEQITRRTKEGGTEPVSTFRERVMMKAPDFIHSEVLEGSVSPDLPRLDSRYRILFLLNSPSGLTGFLRGLGIDLQQVSYARLERYTAYRIGGIEPDRPQILVEKDTFLPLHLVYPDAKTGARVSVHFRDYKRLGGRWYPHQVSTTFEGILMLHTVHSLQADVRFQLPPKEPPRKETPARTPPSSVWDREKEERVRKLIRAFEEM